MHDHSRFQYVLFADQMAVAGIEIHFKYQDLEKNNAVHSPINGKGVLF